MADLTDLQAAQATKIIGADLTGAETFPVNANSAGRMLVDANLTSGQLVPTITNKFRIRLNIANVNVVAAYTTLFSRSGTGLFFGFQAAFNSDKVTIKLTIDSGIVFELNLTDIKQFEFNDTTAGRMQMGGFLTTLGDKLDFSTKYAIPYTSSVVLEVKRSDGANHVNSNWIVFLTEDT